MRLCQLPRYATIELCIRTLALLFQRERGQFESVEDISKIQPGQLTNVGFGHLFERLFSQATQPPDLASDAPLSPWLKMNALAPPRR
jgi:hypothetical protein